MLSVIMLNDVMLSVIMLSVIMPNVVMRSVVAPGRGGIVRRRMGCVTRCPKAATKSSSSSIKFSTFVTRVVTY